MGIVWSSGEISTEVRMAEVTLSVADPLAVPDVAVIVAEPVPTPVAKPVGLTVATFAAFELHVTLLVISVVLPSEKSPYAVNA